MRDKGRRLPSFLQLRDRLAAAATRRPKAASRLGSRQVPSKTSWLSKVAAALFVIAGLAAAASLSLVWALAAIDPTNPAPTTPSVVIETADGASLGRVGRLTDHVPRKDFPDMLVRAVLSIEDRRFYNHPGLDVRGIVRAMQSNVRASEVVEGGSTITQQLAKLEYAGSERSFNRKFREALIALWMEWRLDKEEILTRYLNSVYLGSGAYGMAAAARLYFGKELADLTLAESAMLAGLIQAPSRYDPSRHLEAARRRAVVVLDAMQDAGVIGGREAEKAKAQPVKIQPARGTTPAASWFADWIAKHESVRLFGGQKETIRVRTTLDPRLQALAERAVEQGLASQAAGVRAGQAALVVLRPDGAVVAMVGGRNYADSQFNRAVDAQRQPGSAFKLFVYLAALRNGTSPDDVIDASPVRQGNWRPENSGGQIYGNMTAMNAFARSVNTAAVRLGLEIGIPKVIAAARDLGLDTPLPSLPSIVLGSAETNLLELTSAFAAVRAGRMRLEPWGIEAFGPIGKPLRLLGSPNAELPPLDKQQDLLRLLRAVVDRGTGRAAALPGVSVAGKTGTSQDYRDAWFIGFTDDLVAGVWVGNDDSSPMRGVTGGSLPAEIWRRFMQEGTIIAARSARTPVQARLQLPDASSSDAVASDGAAPRIEVDPSDGCDYAACAAAYNSFRSADCTYQPYQGPRQRCDRRATSRSGGSNRSASSFERVQPGTRRSFEEAPRWPLPGFWLGD
jgi:1A family penicillin-binding protein